MREIDLAAIRERLAATTGPTFWRSLEEAADTEAFRDLVSREFPEHAETIDDPAGRREFLKLMGASLALAGATACTRMPRETIVPYVRAPEEIVPGRPLYFATAMPFDGSATPVLVESHMGRPTKIEPNPDHPATGGGTDVFAQASVLTLYDPARSQVVKHRGEIRSWTEGTAALRAAVAAQAESRGAGLRLLTERVVSPTLAAQIEDVLAALPEAAWYQFEPAASDAPRAASRRSFGEVVDARLHLDRADVILSIGSDFLCQGPGRLRYTRDFADRRRAVDGRADMNRLYVAESTPTNTGAMADHRLAVRAADLESLLRSVAVGLGVPGVSRAEVAGTDAWVAAVVEDLESHRGRSVVVAGDPCSEATHVICHAINAHLANVGRTIEYVTPIEARPAEPERDIRTLAEEMAAGRVQVLLVIAANPVFTAPSDLEFAGRLRQVPATFHLGFFEDETGVLCDWHLPESHYLEAWSDARAFDGTVTICQPLIAPIYDTRSAHEVVELLSPMTEVGARTGYEIVRTFWQRAHAGQGRFVWSAPPDAATRFEDFWRTALHDGWVRGTTQGVRHVGILENPLAGLPAPASAEGLEITFSPDPCVFDGRFANNGWLQELPKPLTKVAWDNVALVAPATAERLGVANEDVIELTVADRVLRAPVWIMPGQPAESVNLQLGYGRETAGRLGTGLGYNAYALRTTAATWCATGASVRGTGDRYELVSMQQQFQMEGRHLVRAATLAEYREHPEFAHELGHDPAPQTTLYGNPWKYEGHAWGMTIDLNACTGCNACVVACQSENNIPVVGKAEVKVGRIMHWIRVDRYFEGPLDNPRTFTQPVPCMQCENAPCEVVCPVGATVHSSEGLNDMVYNRCVGTRYCSNNCPYKVRRFNFLLYADWNTTSLKMQRNPDVTVRSRGVMEKCTYCVQRINHARIQAKLEDRTIRDGEIVTACEAACPASAIAFGDVNDPASRVARLKQEPRNYSILAELNTRPRTTYLAALRNPHPSLDGGAAEETH